MNEAIQRFVDGLAAEPAVRGIILLGSHPAAMREAAATRTGRVAGPRVGTSIRTALATAFLIGP